MKIPTNGNGQPDFNKMVEELKAAKFWGAVEIIFKDGVPGIIKKTETQSLNAQETYRASTYERR